MSVSWRRCQTLGNQVFGSAHPVRIASRLNFEIRLIESFASAHPVRIASMVDILTKPRKELCLSTSRADCIWDSNATLPIRQTLPQHIPCGLHPGALETLLRLFSFASAHPVRIASRRFIISSYPCSFASAHPVRIASVYGMDATTAYQALPQHIPCGLHQQ